VQRIELSPRWTDEHRYGVVDASFRDELPRHWTQVPIAPRFLGGDTGRCPVLVDLKSLQPQELGDLTDQLEAQVFAREETLCSLLLASQLSADRIAMQLAQRISIRVESGGAPKQLRFFDPGTFLQLPELFGGAGMAWLLQNSSSALVPWAGHWTRFDTPTAEAKFRLSGEHVQSLLRIGVVNRVALQLDPPASPESWVRRCREIDGHVRRGQLAYGLNSQSDLVAFATHASVYHAAFDTHPSIQRLFKLLREASTEDELDYRELTSRLSPDDWRTIVRELSIKAETQGNAQ
jgi:hypothetical protein